MTTQPRRARARRASETEQSWGRRTDRRLQWVLANLASLETPVWQVIMVLIKYADESGRTYPAIRTIGDSLGLALVDVEAALVDAEALDLIRPAGISEYDTPAWILQEEQSLPDPLPLFKKAVTDKVRVLLRHISPLEYILLEAMIDIGYKWMDNTIHTTTKQLRDRLPGLGEAQMRDCLHRLCATPYVTRLTRGYGRRPSIFQLELSAVAEAARSGPSAGRKRTRPPDRLAPEQLTGVNKAGDEKLTGVDKVGDEKLTGVDKVVAKSFVDTTKWRRTVDWGQQSGGEQLTGVNNSDDEQLTGGNNSDGEQLTGGNNSDDAPFKEPTTIKPTTDISSSSSQLTTNPSGGDDDDDDRERFLASLGQAFHETVPGAPGNWRRSYAASALTITQPYHTRFGCYPSDDEIAELLARCAAYAARTWAYVAQALSDWVSEQIDTVEPAVPTPSDWHDASAPQFPDERAGQIWQNALDIIRPTVTTPLYDTCLSKTVGLRWADGVFAIEAPNQTVAALIEDRLYTLIAATLQQQLETPVDVAIHLPSPQRLAGDVTP